MPFSICFQCLSNLITPFFLYLHSSHTVAKIRARIPSANSPYLALVSGGSQVYIVLHEEEADEHSVIKMFAAAWQNVRYRWRGEKKGVRDESEGISETEGQEKERRVEEKEEGGCNKAENEERHKRMGAQGGQAHHRL